jgi:hypothetical protein
MIKPYHLMTPAEKIEARIASNRAIAEKVGQNSIIPSKTRRTQAPARAAEVAEFAKVGRAFLDSLPDMGKGTEAASLLALGRTAKRKK